MIFHSIALYSDDKYVLIKGGKSSLLLNFRLGALAIFRVRMKVVARLARFIGYTKGVALTFLAAKFH